MKSTGPFRVLSLLIALIPVWGGLSGCKNYATEGSYVDDKVTKSSQIEGLWKHSDEQNTQSILFRSDGTFTEDDILSGIHVIVDGTFSVSDGKIVLVVTGSGLTVTMFDAKVENDKLYFSQVLKSGKTLSSFWTKA